MIEIPIASSANGTNTKRRRPALNQDGLKFLSLLFKSSSSSKEFTFKSSALGILSNSIKDTSELSSDGDLETILSMTISGFGLIIDGELGTEEELNKPNNEVH